ncbi:hypothetical protein AMAG_04802 [Allomyces macrogynus ATCC 38327]|uniref:PD-(D/E)XK endonuclease-like domain-containing protein n=1 Tax=Allomyces macrogynus (strain ATCC 38327) TaxID=578462 RepID=A0A0L0S6G2_ALLM3|nr:hypothetical protein AMAG_04802 [Allomyces macrogynus ATCC 38327]|eukprot:KNE57971.1 hypothetical protein AMAG_04802 [Allomyces macrogynus ATCC 38327]
MDRTVLAALAAPDQDSPASVLAAPLDELLHIRDDGRDDCAYLFDLNGEAPPAFAMSPPARTSFDTSLPAADPALTATPNPNDSSPAVLAGAGQLECMRGQSTMATATSKHDDDCSDDSDEFGSFPAEWWDQALEQTDRLLATHAHQEMPAAVARGGEGQDVDEHKDADEFDGSIDTDEWWQLALTQTDRLLSALPTSDSSAATSALGPEMHLIDDSSIPAQDSPPGQGAGSAQDEAVLADPCPDLPSKDPTPLIEDPSSWLIAATERGELPALHRRPYPLFSSRTMEFLQPQPKRKSHRRTSDPAADARTQSRSRSRSRARPRAVSITTAPVQRLPVVSVTDISEMEWCELQWFYRRLVGRDEAVLAMFGCARDVEQERTRERGHQIHEKLETELHPKIKVRAKTREDYLALKFLATTFGLHELLTCGQTRELRLHQLVTHEATGTRVVLSGIVDQIDRTETDTGQTNYVVSDHKTRRMPSLPPRAQRATARVQLSVYRVMLVATLCRDSLTDGLALLAALGADPDRPLYSDIQDHILNSTYLFDFAGGFQHRTDILNSSPASSQPPPPVATLRDILIWRDRLIDLVAGPPVSTTMRVTYLYQGDASLIGSVDCAFPGADATRLWIQSFLALATGVRCARGVHDLGDVSLKCGVCEYAPACPWRADRASELAEAGIARAAAAREKTAAPWGIAGAAATAPAADGAMHVGKRPRML